MDIKKELKEKQLFVEDILNKYTVKEGKPGIIFESFNYSLFVGGKRIRPILLMESCKAVGGDIKEAYPLMAAIEMIHTYSLIHDDLPCMDDDELRRGKPTNHVLYGEAMALLAGDSLLNLAYETMIKNCKKAKNITRYVDAMEVIADAAGINGMVAGQVMDMISEGKEPNGETLNFIHDNKTGALLRACILSGAIIGGADEEKMESFKKYADSIGLMFQVVDDILDVVSDSETLGKNVGMDEERNKMTYPYVYGLEKSYEKVEQLLNIALESLSDFDESADFLRNLAVYLSSRKN
ncbi:farnesyl diphosphate synthase [Anaerofustis butyriciformans]|uniref:polyprenyl synthetase family protein n=1 Tax=Anaerofustis butyriciformans TaxID=3108533 RepID=UPI002E337D45|nr:farnesyl diphosphate synthase [Anaerofustis sp. HA2171]